MKYIKNFLNIRFFLLIFSICLTTNLRAQTVSQNLTESAEAIETENTETPRDTAENNLETPAAKKTELEPQADPKPPRFGGHIGIVIPITTRGNNTTTTIAENFIIGFPFALTVRTNSPAAFDFEFIPIINTPSNQDFRFLIHPGIVYTIKKKYAVGIRAAYEIGTGNYGFTPIVNRSFKLKGKYNYFIEADFPVRWERSPNRTRFASFQFAIHSGINF